MKRHWYVVANQRETRIFIYQKDTGHWQSLTTLENPLGLEKNHDLIRKEAGQGTKSFGGRGGAVHFSYKKRRDPYEEAAEQFASKVVGYLNNEWMAKHFTELTIVAEPHFMGKLRSLMTARLQKTVVSWVSKDLAKVPSTQISRYLNP